MAAYGSNAEFIAYLAGQGLVLPAGAPSPLVLRTIGSSYVDSAYEPRLHCSERSDPFNQELAWPRYGAKLGKRDVPDNLIPKAWVIASYRAGYLHAANPGWAQGGLNPARVTKREKAEGFEREFFEAGQGSAAPGFNVDPLIDSMLSPWFCVEEEISDFFFLSIGGGSGGSVSSGGLRPVPPPNPNPIDPEPEPPGDIVAFGEGQVTITQHAPVSSPSVEFGGGQVTVSSS